MKGKGKGKGKRKICLQNTDMQENGKRVLRTTDITGIVSILI